MARREEIFTAMRDYIRIKNPEWEIAPGSPEFKILESVAVQLEGMTFDGVLNDYHWDIDRKNGIALDEFVSLFGFSRMPSKRATGTVLFKRGTPAAKNYSIPRGTQVYVPAKNGVPAIYYQTTDTIILQTGQYSVLAPIEATLGGSIGNTAAGDIVAIVTLVEGVTAVENNQAATGGVDGESDEDLRTRWRTTVFRNMSGTEDQFLAHAYSSDPSVTHANIISGTERYREQLQLLAPSNLNTTSPWVATPTANISGTSVVVDTLDGLPSNTPFYIAYYSDDITVNSYQELMRVCSIDTATKTLTVERGTGYTTLSKDYATLYVVIPSSVPDAKYVYPSGNEIITSISSGLYLRRGTDYDFISMNNVSSVTNKTFVSVLSSYDEKGRVENLGLPFVRFKDAVINSTGFEALLDLQFDYCPVSSRNTPPNSLEKVDIYIDGMNETLVTEELAMTSTKFINADTVGSEEAVFTSMLSGSSTTSASTYTLSTPVTFQDTEGTVTLANHGLANGSIVQFSSITSTTGISINTNYYVVNSNVNTFQLASTANSSALALTTNGTGFMVQNVTLVAGRLYLLSIENSHGTNASVVSAITGGAGVPTYTSRGTTQFNSSLNRVTILSAVPGSDYTGTLTINFGGNTQTGAAWSLIEVRGVNTTSANGIVQFNSSTGTSASASTTLSSALSYSGNITFGAMAHVGSAVTFQDTGDTVTLNTHGLSNGQTVVFTSITSTTGISVNTVYYVISATANTFQLATTNNGTAIALTTNGSGTMISYNTPSSNWTEVHDVLALTTSPQGLATQYSLGTNASARTVSSTVGYSAWGVVGIELSTKNTVSVDVVDYRDYVRADGSRPSKNNLFLQLSQTPIIDIDDQITVQASSGSPAITYYKNQDYWLVEEVKDSNNLYVKGSTRGKAGIEWRKFNYQVAALVGSISNTDTSMIVSLNINLAGNNGTYPFYIQVDDERMLVTAVSSGVFTITRAQQGTLATSHTRGALVYTIDSASVLTGTVQATTSDARMGAGWYAYVVTRQINGIESAASVPLAAQITDVTGKVSLTISDYFSSSGTTTYYVYRSKVSETEGGAKSGPFYYLRRIVGTGTTFNFVDNTYDSKLHQSYAPSQTPAPNKIFQFQYRTNQAVTSVTQLSNVSRLVGQDTATHVAEMVPLKFNFAVMTNSSANVDLVKAAITNAMNNLLMSKQFQGDVQIADVYESVMLNAGVDNVRLTKQSEARNEEQQYFAYSDRSAAGGGDTDTYTLAVQNILGGIEVTEDLSWDDSAVDVRIALESLPSIYEGFANISDITLTSSTTFAYVNASASWPSTPFYLQICDDTDVSTKSVTFQDSGDTVTLNSHGLVNGEIVYFTAITSTTGIVTNTAYYVVNKAANTFQLSTTANGTALALTTNGSGTMSRYLTYNDEIVEVTAVDTNAKTLTVKRAVLGSEQLPSTSYGTSVKFSGHLLSDIAVTRIPQLGFTFDLSATPSGSESNPFKFTITFLGDRWGHREIPLATITTTDSMKFKPSVISLAQTEGQVARKTRGLGWGIQRFANDGRTVVAVPLAPCTSTTAKAYTYDFYMKNNEIPVLVAVDVLIKGRNTF